MYFIFISPHIPHTYWESYHRLKQGRAGWRKQIVYFMNYLVAEEARKR